MRTIEIKDAISKALEKADDNTLVYDLLCKPDVWDTMSDEQRESILMSKNDVKEGRVTLHADVLKQFDAWRGK